MDIKVAFFVGGGAVFIRGLLGYIRAPKPVLDLATAIDLTTALMVFGAAGIIPIAIQVTKEIFSLEHPQTLHNRKWFLLPIIIVVVLTALGTLYKMFVPVCI